jgi:hypothetical protein
VIEPLPLMVLLAYDIHASLWMQLVSLLTGRLVLGIFLESVCTFPAQIGSCSVIGIAFPT